MFSIAFSGPNIGYDVFKGDFCVIMYWVNSLRFNYLFHQIKSIVCMLSFGGYLCVTDFGWPSMFYIFGKFLFLNQKISKRS
jgi:hypothetical protein